ncbi:Toxin SymE, type I toxin-antitoxin system [Chitinophaga eiseniae]|uniref:Toxin SymE, type I toxin-antitoxin system n=1 Tax=Chitinophaga eiseniae TaxID=634771 RepID=A0A1T4MMV6_9BACT|nr:SymE family type I addiction module toxin [Chitinophaga eiseniae]SJZ68135.1 Toxin SymE, type I toxin-antitoxin system [Chitinophaga eiseniae]
MKKEVREYSIGAYRSGRAKSVTIFVPRIELSGKWLEDAGFFADEKVEVHVQNNKIIIRPLTPMPGTKREANKYFKMLTNSSQSHDCIGFGSGMLTR